MEYLNFDYAVVNPKNLIGVDEFNQSFFDKIDQIEVDITNGVNFDTIVKNLDLIPNRINNFKYSSDQNKIEKKIFELRKIDFDLFEIDNQYILYRIKDINKRKPNLADNQTKKEIIELISQQNKFNYNRELLKKINEKKFLESDFIKMGRKNIETLTLNSIKDNKKFEINAIEVLYSLPEKSFTLINDDQNNIYLAKVVKFQKKEITKNDDKFNEYLIKQNSNIKNGMLKSYDLYLNKKYEVVLNQKTIERVKNFFQ